MKKIKRIIGMVCAVALVAALFSGFYRPLAVKAASSKTVRVTTQKELNKALKDASVETIILRSETYDSITISSKKAKKKNIIIDAENSNIVNKSRFKSIELISAAYYIEDVSNNTITASTTAFEIAEGRTVKKLTLTVMSSKYVIRKGASIKNLAYNLGGNKSKYNKSTRTLKVMGESFDWQTYDYVTINYTLRLDEVGRVLYVSYKEPSSKRLLETDAVYDENGNLLEVKEVYSDNGEVSLELSYKYDKNNNVVYSYENSGYFIDEDTLEYDSKGKVIKDTFTTSSGAEGYFEYTYDSKGRKTKSVYYYYSGPDMTFNDTTTYTYNKKGYLTKSISESKSGSKTVNTYKYNSDGNMYYYSSDDYDENGFVDRYEYKYEFDEYGVMLVGYIKYPDSDEWYDMSELGD